MCVCACVRVWLKYTAKETVIIKENGLVSRVQLIEVVFIFSFCIKSFWEGMNQFLTGTYRFMSK